MPTLADDFTAFWAAYPRRTAKLDAMKAYAKARTIASAEEILDGVMRYIQHKPEYADWCHPSTFLNKGRWMDEYDAPTQPEERVNERGEDWFAECERLHQRRCNGRQGHALQVWLDQQNKESA